MQREKAEIRMEFNINQNFKFFVLRKYDDVSYSRHSVFNNIFGE